MEERTLRDGTGVLLWPVLPSDRATLQQGYSSLSDQSRFRRFLTAVPALSDRMLDVLVDGVDGVDHVALLVLALPSTGHEELVAVGRLIRYARRPDAADVAVTVADGWHGRGVATVLLEELMRRRPAGVERLVTSVSRDNPAALRMLRRLGPTTVEDSRTAAVEVVVELDPDGAG